MNMQNDHSRAFGFEGHNSSMHANRGGFDPHGFDARGGFHTLPAGPEGPEGGHGGPRGGHGLPPHDGRPPFRRGGRPPHGPSPEALKERIREGGLAELLELAGRMLHHRPEGGPARGQQLILSILAGREDLSQRELQALLGVQPGSLSELLTKLEKKSLLTRTRDEDRRGNRIRLTDEGRAAIADAPDADDGLFGALTADQRQELQALLRTLLLDWADRSEPLPHELPSEAPGRFIPLGVGPNEPRQV